MWPCTCGLRVDVLTMRVGVRPNVRDLSSCCGVSSVSLCLHGSSDFGNKAAPEPVEGGAPIRWSLTVAKAAVRAEHGG